jgi:hypothetical protein
MGVVVILLVIGLLALGAYLLYGRRRPVHDPGSMPDASLHVKDDVRDVRSAADQFRDGTGGGGTGWA